MALNYGNAATFTVRMEGPFGSVGGTVVKLTSITLPAADWKGAESPYFQVVAVEGVSVNSMVDLQPSVEQIENTAFTTENDGGVVTVYAIGDKPTNDYTIQATIMEVIA